MLIRYKNILAEVNIVEYIEAERQGKLVTGVQLAADTRLELATLMQAYTNISNVDFFGPESIYEDRSISVSWYDV